MYFSPLHYAFVGMMQAQFPVEGYDLTEEILVQYGFDKNNYWGCLGMLTLLFILLRVLVVVSLWLQDLEFHVGATGDTRN